MSTHSSSHCYPYAQTHACACTHICTHTITWRHISAHMQNSMQKYTTHTYNHTHSPILLATHTHTYSRTCPQRYSHTLTQSCILTLSLIHILLPITDASSCSQTSHNYTTKSSYISFFRKLVSQNHPWVWEMHLWKSWVILTFIVLMLKLLFVKPKNLNVFL